MIKQELTTSSNSPIHPTSSQSGAAPAALPGLTTTPAGHSHTHINPSAANTHAPINLSDSKTITTMTLSNSTVKTTNINTVPTQGSTMVHTGTATTSNSTAPIASQVLGTSQPNEQECSNPPSLSSIRNSLPLTTLASGSSTVTPASSSQVKTAAGSSVQVLTQNKPTASQSSKQANLGKRALESPLTSSSKVHVFHTHYNKHIISFPLN